MGSEVPDAFSAIMLARHGYYDGAIAGVIGSQVGGLRSSYVYYLIRIYVYVSMYVCYVILSLSLYYFYMFHVLYIIYIHLYSFMYLINTLLLF